MKNKSESNELRNQPAAPRVIVRSPVQVGALLLYFTEYESIRLLLFRFDVFSVSLVASKSDSQIYELNKVA